MKGIRIKLVGAFKHGQLVTCSYDRFIWNRRLCDTTEEMEKRIVSDLRELTGVHHQSALVESGVS